MSATSEVGAPARFFLRVHAPLAVSRNARPLHAPPCRSRTRAPAPPRPRRSCAPACASATTAAAAAAWSWPAADVCARDYPMCDPASAAAAAVDSAVIECALEPGPCDTRPLLAPAAEHSRAEAAAGAWRLRADAVEGLDFELLPEAAAKALLGTPPRHSAGPPRRAAACAPSAPTQCVVPAGCVVQRRRKGWRARDFKGGAPEVRTARVRDAGRWRPRCARCGRRKSPSHLAAAARSAAVTAAVAL
jgi:hypothetical protein